MILGLALWLPMNSPDADGRRLLHRPLLPATDPIEMVGPSPVEKHSTRSHLKHGAIVVVSPFHSSSPSRACLGNLQFNVLSRFDLLLSEISTNRYEVSGG